MSIPVIILLIISTCNGCTVCYYEDIINSQINESLEYEYPTDAYSYQATDSNEINDFGSFDYVIIGAGSTGTVIANRLSEINHIKTLVLEAGDFGNDGTDIPNLMRSTRLTHYDWSYVSVPQTTCCQDMVNKQCTYPRGKGVGGSAIINGLVYTRCNKLDFDKWSELGNQGWSYKEVLPYFKKSEKFVQTDPSIKIDYQYHGYEGNSHVEFSIPKHPLANVWLNANSKLGYNYTDYNGEEQMGASIPQVNTKKGKRVEGGNAFILPILNRKNLLVLTGSYVTKILIDNSTKTAESVLFTRNGKLYTVKANREVILSAGSIESPKILMLSGVGPEQDLEKFNIPVITNLQVGKALRDHPLFYGMSFTANLSLPSESLEKYIKDYLHGLGSLTFANSAWGIGFYRTKYEPDENYPDLELLMFPNDQFLKTLKQQLSFAKEKTWEHLDESKTFEIYIVALHTKSNGNVTLKSANPFDYPLIDSQFISDSENIDINTIYEGVKLVLNLTKTKPFMDINATLYKQNIPACNDLEFLTEAYWKCLIPQLTSNIYHPIGTCPMGPKPENGDVVNYEGKVHGIEKLRVADASVIPFPLSGHPNAVCVMIGEKISQLIKQSIGL